MSEKLKSKIEIKTENNINLSEEERKIIENLTLQENKNEVEVIILTRKELQEFRNLLNKNPRDEIALNEFINKQKMETISTSEVMQGSEVVENLGGIENFKDISDLFNETIYKHFFKNNESPFYGFNISEDAKRNFSTGANFFFINFLAKELENTGTKEDFAKKVGEIFGTDKKEGFLENINSLSGLINKIKGNLNMLTDLFTGDLGKTLSKVYKPEKEALLKEVFTELQIENYEEEAIFMNPLESYNFMDFVYNENHSKEEIKSYINERRKKGKIKFSQEDKDELKIIGDKISVLITPEIGGTLGKFHKIKEDFSKIKDGIKDKIVNNKEIIGIIGALSSIPILGDFIKTFLEMIGITNLDKILSGKDFEASKKTISENIVGKGSIFEGKKIDENTFMQVNGNNDTAFLSNINYLVGEKEGKDFEKEVKKIFKNGGDFDNFIKNEKVGIKFEGDTINYEKFKKSVSLFVEYKVAVEKEKSLSVENFMDKKEKEKEVNQDTINQALALTTIQANPTTQAPEIKSSQEVKLTSKTTTETTTKEANKELFIKEAEGLEINQNNITAIFEVNGIKYKLQLLQGKSDKGNLIITGGGKVKVFEGGADISSYLAKNFGGKLKKDANASDFGKNIGPINPKLGGTIEKILIEGYKKELGLKQLFIDNFFEKGKFKDFTSITFQGTNYNFAKIS